MGGPRRPANGAPLLKASRVYLNAAFVKASGAGRPVARPSPFATGSWASKKARCNCTGGCQTGHSKPASRQPSRASSCPGARPRAPSGRRAPARGPDAVEAARGSKMAVGSAGRRAMAPLR